MVKATQAFFDSSVLGQDESGNNIPLPQSFYQDPDKIIPGTELNLSNCEQINHLPYRGTAKTTGITYGDVIKASGSDGVPSFGEMKMLAYVSQVNLSKLFKPSCLEKNEVFAENPVTDPDNASLTRLVRALRGAEINESINAAKEERELLLNGLGFLAKVDLIKGAQVLSKVFPIYSEKSLSIESALIELGIEPEPIRLNPEDRALVRAAENAIVIACAAVIIAMCPIVFIGLSFNTGLLLVGGLMLGAGATWATAHLSFQADLFFNQLEDSGFGFDPASQGKLQEEFNAPQGPKGGEIFTNTMLLEVGDVRKQANKKSKAE